MFETFILFFKLLGFDFVCRGILVGPPPNMEQTGADATELHALETQQEQVRDRIRIDEPDRVRRW